MFKTYLRLMGFARPIKKYAIPYFFYSVFYALFNSLTFMLIIPILNTMFDVNYSFEYVEKLPPVEFNQEYLTTLFNFTYSHLFQEYDRQNVLLLLAIVAIIISFLSNLFRYLGAWTMENMRTRTLQKMRNEMFSRVMDMNVGYFSDQRLGTIQTTLTSTVVELEQYSMLFITDITGGVSMSVIIIVMMMFFSPWFSLLSLAGLLVGLYVLGMVQKAAAEHTPKVQEAQEELVTQSLEYIRGIAVLRSFSQTVGQDGAVYQSFHRRQKAALDQEKAALPALRLYILVFKLTGCALMFLSTFLYLQGAISLIYCFLFLVASFILYSEMEVMGDGSFLDKKIATELLDKGWCRVTGLYTPKKPQLYDAVIRLDDSGGKYVSFKMEFDK